MVATGGQEFKTVHDGHKDIEQYDLRYYGSGQQEIECLHAIYRSGYHIALFRQYVDQCCSHIGIVIDYENMYVTIIHAPFSADVEELKVGRPAVILARNGNSTENKEPRFGVLSTSI